MVDQRTLSALYHAGLRSELTRTLGVRWRPPEHGIADIAEFPSDVLDHFSQRTRHVNRRLADKLKRFETDLDRSPTRRERWRLAREAVVDSRPTKPHGHSATDLRRWWRDRLDALGHDPRRLVAASIGQQIGPGGIDQAATARMIERSLSSLTESQSTWRAAEIVRELAAAVPTDITVEPDRLIRWLDRCAEQLAVTNCVDISSPVPEGMPTRRDGRPISEAAVDRVLTTEGIVQQEEQIIDWAERRLNDPPAPGPAPSNLGTDLDPAQRAAADLVAGTRQLELVVGPAGTGKTTALAPAVHHLQATGRAVFGVTPNAAAAQVLATETGMTSDTLDKLLYEHCRPDRQSDPAYALPSGTTVVVDEAGAVSTPKLALLARLADEKRWRVVLVGDSRQFSAVGRGGMFGHLVSTYGAVELDRVHRFMHHWERNASLRLRNGDPSTLIEYDRRGRLHGGTHADLEPEIVEDWRRARGRRETVALMASSNETVERLNRLAQQARIHQGELDPRGSRLRIGQQVVLVGDEVVTRRNDRRLRTDRDLMVKNRDHWIVSAIHRDRNVTLSGSTGTIRLPADYVARDVELGYAQTSHASQGRTVDTALVLVDAPIDHRGVYTPMTRGRLANHAYVVTEDGRTALDVLSQALTREWIDQPAVARRAEIDRYRRPRRQLVGNPDRATASHPSVDVSVILAAITKRRPDLSWLLQSCEADGDQALGLPNSEQHRRDPEAQVGRMLPGKPAGPPERAIGR